MPIKSIEKDDKVNNEIKILKDTIKNVETNVKTNRKVIFSNRLNTLIDEMKENKVVGSTIKISNTNIANEIGVTRQALNYYCNGEKMPDLEQLLLIKNYFNVTLEYLVGESETRNYNDYSTEKKYGFNQETINNLEIINNKKEVNDSLVFTINQLLGQEDMKFIKKLCQYITIPSKDNEHILLSPEVKIDLGNFLKSNRDYDGDTNVYVMVIFHELLKIIENTKKSKKAVDLFVNLLNEKNISIDMV